jgi:hypothetical protein
MFSEGRLDFAAPKNNSPSAIAGIDTPDAWSGLDITASSPFSKAMMTFVSRRNLPLASFDPFAFLFDSPDHLPGRNSV